MRSIEEMVADSMTALQNEGKVESIVKVNLEKAITEAVKDAVTGYNSPFKKALKEYVAGALPMDFKGIGLDGYNAMVMAVLKRKLDASLEAWVDKAISEDLQELLQTPPGTINVSDLLKQLEKEQEEDHRHQGLTCHVSEGNLNGYWTLNLDAKPGVKERDCGFNLSVDNEGQVYHMSFPYKGDVTSKMFVGRLHGFERTLFRLYIGKTKLILDPGWREWES